MEKRWNIQDVGNNPTVSELQQLLNVDRIIASLLFQRKINTFEEAKMAMYKYAEELGLKAVKNI